MLTGGIVAALVILAVFVGLGLFFCIIAFLPGKHSEVKEKLKTFFGREPEGLPIVAHTFRWFEFPNVQLAINEFLKERNVVPEVYGMPSTSLRDTLGTESKFTAIRYQDVDIAESERLKCAENCLYLLRSTEQIALSVSLNSYRKELNVEIMTLGDQVASECLRELRERISKVQVLRGKVISPASSAPMEGESGWDAIHFTTLPTIAREEIILPEETLELIERNSIGFWKHSQLLRRHGQSIKRGLLFSGPPGTGKTYVSQWIAQNVPGITVFLLSGEQLWLIKDFCRMARMLEPALLIMEDVDLIATARGSSSETTVLHQLLNEMDGIGSDCNILFLLTTNCPEVLEPALASRPGRIDQVVEFPIPDEECRQRLLRLYARNLSLRLDDEKGLIRRTHTATPAFMKELVRKAALFAADQVGEEEQKLSVTSDHFENALEEMTLGSAGTTRRIFGFSTS